MNTFLLIRHSNYSGAILSKIHSYRLLFRRLKLEVAFHLYKKENQVSERPLAEEAEPNLHFQLPITYRKDRMT